MKSLSIVLVFFLLLINSILNFIETKLKRNHSLFGMVTSILPFRSFQYGAPTHHYHQPHMAIETQTNIIEPHHMTISRNFSPSGDGKSLLHQTFDRKILERNVGAPLRTSVNVRNQFEIIPRGIL